MRDRTAWRARALSQLRPVCQAEKAEVDAGLLLDVELALYLLFTLRPQEPAEAGYELLSGYPVIEALGMSLTSADNDRLAVARQLLAPLRTRRDWTTAVDHYRSVPEHLRGFLLDSAGRPVRREPSVAPDRFEVFERALADPPRMRRKASPMAGHGTFTTVAGGRSVSVTIPDDFVLPLAPAGHDTSPRADRQPVSFSWGELEGTARWLDEKEAGAGLAAADRGSWHRRFGRMRLRLRRDDEFGDADQVEIAGVLHMIGMVGSGKSTLMLLMAACAARRGQQVTLVVGDVLSALRHVTWLRAVGLTAAPVVGASRQRAHIDRMHKVHATAHHPGSSLAEFEGAADILSTACALDALRPSAMPWSFQDSPCRDRLTPAGGRAADRRLACPLWAGCQRHAASRDLVSALVWVATPASLIHSRIPSELNPEQMRYLELAWRRSDLIIVDEADQVQAQLDDMFSPGQTLIGNDGDAWLEMLIDHTETELRGHGRAQFAGRPVREWSASVDTARTTANRLYAVLQRHPLPRGQSTMRRWIGRDCFTEWTLASKLIRSWSGSDGSDPDNLAYRDLRAAFDAFLLDPLGTRGRTGDIPLAGQLAALLRTLVNLSDEDLRADRVREWLSTVQTSLTGSGQPNERENGPVSRPPFGWLSTEELDEQALRLEFTLLLALLSNTLNSLIRGWRAVEGPLNMDASSGMIFQRPPEDFTPVVPAPAMGSVLGYQYRDEPDQPDQMGQLRFFRCTGVGRWVLLHLHDLFRPDSPTGPAVLLMSGTSWAGTSPRYDIQAEVSAILQAPPEELDAVRESEFFLSTVNDEHGIPVAVSGLRGDRRRAALRTILRSLASQPYPGRPSRFEAEFGALPPHRQRILLVVGSYREARQVAEDLLEIRPDWTGQVLHLVADESEFTTHWAQSLRRGDVARLAATGARFLVAPLLAIERGHNILTGDGQAAIGSGYFLVRPHPRPDDISYPVQAMNRWAVEQISKMRAGTHSFPAEDLHQLTRAFRRDAYLRWQRMLTVPLAYGSLDPVHDQPALAWTQLVTIWQVIGRLIRGGSPARVHFCDARFTPGPEARDAGDSLLTGMYRVLHQYLRPGAAVSPADRELADALYGPLYQALTSLPGVPDAQL